MKTKLTTVVVVALTNLVNGACGVRAAEVKARVIDGYGRPLVSANVEVRLTEKSADGKVTNVHWLKMSSDQDGQVNGSYDEERVSGDVWVYLSKDGYGGYSTTLGRERREEYVMKRVFGPKDVRRVTRLTGKAQEAELGELLAGDYVAQGEDEGLQ